MRIEVMELHCMLDNTAKIDISHWTGNENDRTKDAIAVVLIVNQLL